VERPPIAAFAAGSAVAAVVLIVNALITSAPTFVTSGTFNFSQVLPTSPVSSANPPGCGANVTERLSFPAGIVETFEYSGTVNISGAYINFWINGPQGPIEGTLEYGGMTGGGYGDGGAASTYTFTFQGCAPFSGVPLGFWGYYQPYSAP
jgi:hypothetical protein